MSSLTKTASEAQAAAPKTAKGKKQTLVCTMETVITTSPEFSEIETTEEHCVLVEEKIHPHTHKAKK